MEIGVTSPTPLKERIDAALIPNWREKWHRLWSVRILLLASVLDGAAAGWFIFAGAVPGPIFFGISMVLPLFAAVARLVKQDLDH